MIMGILKQINWIDILILVFFLRIAFVSLKSGLPVEFFKLLGTISAIYVAMQYYIKLALLLADKTGIENLSLEIVKLICFIILASAGYLLFVLVRMLVCRFLKMEAVPELNMWGGFITGICRGALLISLILFVLVLSNVKYLNKSVRNSYSAKTFFVLAPGTYKFLWRSVFSKIEPDSRLNKEVIAYEKGMCS